MTEEASDLIGGGDTEHSGHDEAPDAVDCCTNCMGKFSPKTKDARSNIVILMFELIGTFFMTCIFNEGGMGLFFGYYVALLMAAAISGAHFNPAVTMAFMIRRNNKLPKGIGILYILFQFIGACLGGIFSWNFIQVNGPHIGCASNVISQVMFC